MSFGDRAWGDWIIDDEEKVFAILKHAYDKGIRTFDTADVYSNGKSEILLGKFIKKYNIKRDRIVILSKTFFAVDAETPGYSYQNHDDFPAIDYFNSQGLSRKHILEGVEASVKRLGTYIDVMQIHRLDQNTPKKEIMKALNDIVDQGLARYIGASSMKAVEFAELQFIAEKNGWHKFISMQNYYNLIYREEEREMIPFCKENSVSKVGIIPWSPLAGGYLTRPVAKSSDSFRAETDKVAKGLKFHILSDADKEIITRVEKVAKDHDVSMAVVATAWSIAKGCNPIVGLSSVERVDDILKAIDLKLSEEEVNYLEEPYVPKVPIV
ncbi:AAD16 putative aryl-alcohol dehydrogenase AAD16 [Candida maltosa Xu316]